MRCAPPPSTATFGLVDPSVEPGRGSERMVGKMVHGTPGRRTRRRGTTIAVGLLTGALTLSACSSSSDSGSGGTGGSGSERVGVTLILKTLSNPYFVTMEKDAQDEAAKQNVDLSVAAGKQDGDTQIADRRHRQRHLPR